MSILKCLIRDTTLTEQLTTLHGRLANILKRISLKLYAAARLTVGLLGAIIPSHTTFPYRCKHKVTSERVAIFGFSNEVHVMLATRQLCYQSIAKTMLYSPDGSEVVS